jgi:thioredoxin-related protein
MKYPLLVTFIIVTSIPITAQQWMTSIEEAKKLASEKNQNIVLVFQGSDWCAPCIKLDKAVWSTDEFRQYARDHFVMLQADFPRKKANQLPEALQQQNSKLAEKYNKEGYFPLVVVLDKNGEILGTTGYKNISVKEYIELLESFNI